MPTKINTYSATTGEAIQLLPSWFGTQLSQTPMGAAADSGGELHHACTLGAPASQLPINHERCNTPVSIVEAGQSPRLGGSSGSLSALTEHCSSATARRRSQLFAVEGLVFDYSDEALAWTMTKRQLLAAISKADNFVSTRTCPYDLLIGVGVADNHQAKNKRTTETPGSPHASSPTAFINGSFESTACSAAASIVGAKSATCDEEEPMYIPWPLNKSTLGDILSNVAEDNGVSLKVTEGAPKASDAVGFAAAMVAKLCRKAVLENPNQSEASFTVNLLVLSRPIGNEYSPSHCLYRVQHAPSAATKEKCSSSMVLSILGKVMEETRLIASGQPIGTGSNNGSKTNSANNRVSNSFADRPPLPRAAIGVAEKVKQYGPQLLQELKITEMAITANQQRKAEIEREGAAAAAARQTQREAQEAMVLERLLYHHFSNSIGVVVQFTGCDERDALFALMESHSDLESAAAKLMEGSWIPLGRGPVPVARLRQGCKDYLDPKLVAREVEKVLGKTFFGGPTVTASGAPLAAAGLPLVDCADRLVGLGYDMDEAHRASRGAAGNFEFASSYLAGAHSVARMVRQHYEETMWFEAVTRALREGTSKSTIKEVTEVVSMVAEDPQSVLIAWHTASLQPAVKLLSDCFVQAIMQVKQAALLRMQQQQAQQPSGNGRSCTNNTIISGGPKYNHHHQQQQQQQQQQNQNGSGCPLSSAPSVSTPQQRQQISRQQQMELQRQRQQVHINAYHGSYPHRAQGPR